MAIIALVIIGAAAGFLATKIMKVEMDLISTVVVGIFGALIGGLVLRFVLFAGGLIGGLVGAVAGATLLIWLWQTYFKR